MTSFPPKNILLIQLGDIGDVVITTPTIRAVKEAYPAAHLSIMVRSPFGSLLEADPHLHEIIESHKPKGAFLRVIRDYFMFACRLKRAKYDLVIDLRTGDRGAFLAFMTRAPVRVGRQVGDPPFWRQLLFTQTISELPCADPPVHLGADQSLRIVRALGIDTPDTTPKLQISPAVRERARQLLDANGLASASPWVSINPCSRWKYKEWGVEKWGEVSDWLWREYRCPVIIVGGAEDTAVGAQIVADRSSHAFNLAGRTTLGQLAALLQMSSLHLGIDSAAAHIAAAVGTPVVTIFGPGDWQSWTIVDELHRVVTADLPCRPCNHKGCEDSEQSLCLDQLEVSRVVAVVAEIAAMIPSMQRCP